jgi:superfamily II RNA helicase
VGNVIHLNNLFAKTEIGSYKMMLKGAPQQLVSNFKISYNLLLENIAKEMCLTDLAKRSMIQYKIGSQISIINSDIDRVSKDIDRSKQCVRKVPIDVLEEYVSLKAKLPTLVNKKRRECDKAISKLEDEYKNIAKDVEPYKISLENDLKLINLTNELTNVENMLDSNVLTVLNLLEDRQFIVKEDTKYNILLKGHVATHFKEVPCLIFANLIIDKKFDDMLPREIAGFLSCFTNVKISDDHKARLPVSTNKNVVELIKETSEMCNIYYDLELKEGMNTGTDYEMIFDLTDYIILWADCTSEPECKLLLQQIKEEKGIFLGEFIKAILKIIAITVEIAAVAELVGDLQLLQNLREVPLILQKFVATNQSLYV